MCEVRYLVRYFGMRLMYCLFFVCGVLEECVEVFSILVKWGLFVKSKKKGKSLKCG